MKTIDNILEEYGLLEVRASWVNQRKGKLLNVIDNNTFMFLWSIIWLVFFGVISITMYGQWVVFLAPLLVFISTTYFGYKYLFKTVASLRAQWLRELATRDKDTYDKIVEKYRKEIVHYLVNIK